MLLAVNQLTKKFKQHTAVDELSLAVKEKECVALLGPNGSGKTTTLNMLAGLLKPTSGEIFFMGKRGIDRSRIGYLPQYPAFFSWMTAREYLHFAGKLSHIPKKALSSKVDEMLAFVGLEDEKNKRIGGFSGGMKQRLGIAQALLHEPKLLILDEPVSALDPEGRRDVLQMMQQLKRKLAILFSTHVLHDAEQVCDRTVILKDGKVKWSGDLNALKQTGRKVKCVLHAEAKLKPWLSSIPYAAKVHFRSATCAEITLQHERDRMRLLKDCVAREIDVTHFEMKKHSLEDAYLEVMNE